MKRQILNWTLTLGVFAILAFSGCKKDDTIFGCADALERYTNAYSDYSSNPNAQTCQELSDALRNYISTCTPGKFYESQLDDLDCSGF